ncbi:hypothetical protein [Vibrio metschnikovii]
MIDIIGTLYDVGSEDQDNVIVTELDGYHVNSTSLVDEWQQFKVEPSTPRHTFFGVPTHFYRFADESEFREHYQNDSDEEF